MSASCSIEPLSRRSASLGRLSSRFDLAVELGQHHQRHLVLAGHALERGADLAHPAVVVRHVQFDQAEVVDEDRADLLALGARPPDQPADL